MSRNQKPGKFKLVGSGAQPNYGRRAGDAMPGDPKVAPGDPQAPAPIVAAEGSGSPGLLLPLLFLAACAAGGMATVYFGLVGGTPA
ncbi:hypothetical protein ABVV53_02725 [Novosphingobium sp. RD2P27]|uniref:Uncharacterized protein n=1 Tax=Novosphingobium kalidii TaxID=3230299 RepID=A0ABV2CXQ3_9SPHN